MDDQIPVHNTCTMIKKLILLLLIASPALGQYEVAYVKAGDTIFLKTGSDSLFNKSAGNYAFRCKVRLKANNLFGFASGLQSLLDETGELALNRASHTGTQPASTITGLAAVALSNNYNDLTNKPSTAGYTTVQLSGDVINNNASANTLADAGLGFDVVAGTTYKFKFVIFYTSAATTTGSRHTINGPATTFLMYRSSYTLTATSRTFNEGLTGYNVPSGASATSVVAGNMAVIEGVITPSANGTVIARFASEISNSAVTAKAKSYVEYQAL
jgi:hypothetical protein